MTRTAPQTAQQKQTLHGTALSTLRSRLRIGTALAGMVLPLGIPGLALAANECGPPLGGVVTCTAGGSPYAGGIAYSGTNLTLNLSADAQVRTSVAGVQGVVVSGDGDTLELNLQGGVVTEGANTRAIDVTTDAAVSTLNVNSIESAGEGLQVVNYNGSAFINVGSIDSAQHGLIALSYGGPFTIDVDSIATTDNDARAIDAYVHGLGALTIDSADQISTQGDRSTAILAGTYGDVVIDVNSVTTSGANSNAIEASSMGAGSVTIDAVSVTTQGERSSGVVASTSTGNIDINVGGVSTVGDNAIAVKANSNSGTIEVDNTGVISTAGEDSIGIVAASPGGDVTVTNSGTITTSGDEAHGINAESLSGTVTVTNSGSVTTTGGNAHAILAQNDQGDIVIDNSGSVSATGEGSAAIQAAAGAGDITVTSTGTVTTVDGTAISAETNQGNVLIDATSVSAGGAGRAINASSIDGNIDVTVGSASTTGEEGTVIYMRGANGNLTLDAGTVTSQGGASYGVYATTDTGAIDLKANSIVTQGADSSGIMTRSNSGPIAIDVGSVTTTGDWADAINAGSTTGTVTVNARGAISTAGDYSNGVSVATDGDVNITVNDISTTGRGSDAVTASSGSGRLTVVANGTITTTGKSAKGIAVSSDSGDIDVTAGNIDTTRDDAHGIEANSTSGKVRVVSNGTIAVRGENAHGIKAGGGAGTTVIADSVSVSGYRADGIVLSGDAGIDLKLRNLSVTGDGSDGIIADATAGAVLIDVGNVHVSDGRAISAQTGAGDTTVQIAGKVRGEAEEIMYAASTGDTRINILAGGEVSSISGTSTAIFATGANVVIDNAGLISATTVPTVIARGTVRLNNSGTFIGGVSFDDGDDVIVNSGTFSLSGISDFGLGNDRFSNTGIVNLLASATLEDLELFENSGLVTMANNHAGDILTLSGDYVGTNGRLVLDIGANSGGVTHDQLVIGGAASGTTTIALNSLRNGAMLPGRTLTLVDAAGGSAAGAFVLAPETVNGGFAHYTINYDGLGDDFYISASEGLGLFQMLKVNEGAQALWRQSADAWSSRTASLRDPAKDGVEHGPVWFQFYSSADERDQTYAASAGDFDISYRQKHVGGQVGADLGTLGGLTYGLTGGYLASALKFAGTNDRTDYDAFNLGAYAQGQWGNYFVNGLAKYDVFGAKIDSVTGAFTEKLDGTAYGLQLEAGARFGNADFFIEPVASVAYSRTNLDTLAAGGATVDFDAANSLRGKIGARIGGSASVGASMATFYLGAHLVNEFEGKDGVRFDTGTSTSVLANDPVDAYGQFQLGATVVSETGLNGFVEGTASIGNDYQNYGGRMGVRLAF